MTLSRRELKERGKRITTTPQCWCRAGKVNVMCPYYSGEKAGDKKEGRQSRHEGGE